MDDALRNLMARHRAYWESQHNVRDGNRKAQAKAGAEGKARQEVHGARKPEKPKEP